MKNLSQLITSLKMDLGIYGLALPFENPDAVLHDVIKLKTIKTFSAFVPHVIQLDMQMGSMDLVRNAYDESIYRIPDMFGDRTLISVRSVEPVNRIYGMGYVDPILSDGYDVFNGLAMSQANANLHSLIVPSVTFEFIAPNTIKIRNMQSISTELRIQFDIEHAENLSTIKPTSMAAFEELALLDIQRFLYNALKHYTDLQTAYGSISLKIDEWANAKDERAQLLDKWRDIYHLDIVDPIHFI